MLLQNVIPKAILSEKLYINMGAILDSFRAMRKQ